MYFISLNVYVNMKTFSIQNAVLRDQVKFFFMTPGEQIKSICGKNYGYDSGKKECCHGNSFSLNLKEKEIHPSQKSK